jgi:uncharacterized membrane protein YheB (UPF0754 family)
MKFRLERTNIEVLTMPEELAKKTLKTRVEENLGISAMFFAVAVAAMTAGFIEWLDKRISENIPTIQIDTVGEVINWDTIGDPIRESTGVDKRFIADSSCKPGDVRVAKINEDPDKKQVGLCGCAESATADSKGHGWYCID